MANRKPPDSERRKSQQEISGTADDWIRQFVKEFDWQFLDASRKLTANTDIAELRVATARAILATFVDSGMEFESALEIFGQLAIERQSVDITWSDTLNQRRLALIDKEIQGELAPSERIELAGLTRIMRDPSEAVAIAGHSARM